MFGLVHLIETWPKEIYVKTLLKELASSLQKSPFWMEKLFNRIFNDENYLSILKQSLHLTDREAFSLLLETMEEEFPHHRELIQQLRYELERQYK